MAPQTIAVIGGLDADLIMISSRIPDRGESVLANEYIEALGGKGANSAIATYRTCHKRPVQDERAIEYLSLADDGIEVKMIGAVGDDQYGGKFIVELNKNGVDTSGIVTVPDTRSSVCFVMVEHSTRENRCLFTLGATATWKKEHFSNAENLGGGARPDLVVAQMEISKDVSEAAIMSGRDRDEVNEDSWSAIAQEFLGRGVKNVVITLGAKGAFYANADDSAHCPAYEVVVKDTTGAGLAGPL
ncbi:Ribokinase-like protein [Lasiosphaeria miniovina]|uniref:Ribokinase-like protein n=1 Tax=Lasiosphaeria miniovina TaxID=1954250 RepID=A0AA40E9G4_9PEZI|nr:Ribokinase-like protein [Lasiosphaeria miniovina]KAK0727293.1 Ribokinase-like protein [Lasiosphaeria miniovina]